MDDKRNVHKLSAGVCEIQTAELPKPKTSKSLYGSGRLPHGASREPGSRQGNGRQEMHLSGKIFI